MRTFAGGCLAKVWFGLLAWTFALSLALGVRIAPIAAAKPYIAYVDEGNFLHPVVRLLREGGWDPRSYMYPQFPAIAVAAATRAYAPIHRRFHQEPIARQYSTGVEVYDVLEPFELLVIARAMSMLASVGVVVLTGVLAHRLAGWRAGAAAALLAAVTPALAIRGAIATVDPYAALFAVACLIATDASRSSSRPGFLSFVAGFLSGCAFASKYPAAMVGIAFCVTTFLEPIVWLEKGRRIVLAALGLVTGAVVAMPAVVLHPVDVYGAMHDQMVIYSQMTSPSLWEQAVVRAEWDIPYTASEMGLVYLALAAIGFVVAVRERRWAPTLWGWFAFLVAGLALYLRQSFQPFRNILPLVPLACIAVALLYVSIRQRLWRPIWADALGTIALVEFLFIPLAGYAWERTHVVDSRTEVMEWLVANTRPDDHVLVVRDLGFVNRELARLSARPTTSWWHDAEKAISESQPRYVVAGILIPEGAAAVDVALLPSIAATYVVRLQTGEQWTPCVNWWWRGNRQLIYILERKVRESTSQD